MKKLISLLLCIALLLTGLCACGGKSSQVPDSQLEYDVSNLYHEIENDCSYNDVQSFKKSYNRLGSVSGWKATHDVNKDMYLDTVTLDLFFDEWLGTLQFKTTRVYQYSRESDIWSLIDVKNFEYIGITEYNTEQIKSIEGKTFSKENCSDNDSFSGRYYDFSIYIESVDPQNLTANVEYSIVKYTSFDFSDELEYCDSWNGSADVDIEIPDSYRNAYRGAYLYGDAYKIVLNIPFGDSTLSVELSENGELSRYYVEE